MTAFTPSRLLVTGGSGFIGSNFVRCLLAKDETFEIVNLDKLTYAGNPENLADLEDNPRYSFVEGDITEQTDVAAAMKGCDGVVHFAAETHVDRSIAGPEVFSVTNVLGTQLLLDQARAQGIERFVHISTDEVYGTLGAEGRFTEESPLEPNSPYSASKAGSDLVCRAYHETFDFPVIITRCSNNYGPYQSPDKLIPVLILKALADEPLPIYGDGQHVRDWLFVEDHCAAVDLVLREGSFGEVYNIGGNTEKQNLEIAKLVLVELGKPESLIEMVDDRPGHDRRYAIDSTKIKQDLGWEPAHQFEAALPKTIAWYRDHLDWAERFRERIAQAT